MRDDRGVLNLGVTQQHIFNLLRINLVPRCGDEELAPATEIKNPIAQASIGSKVKLTYIRDRAQKETTAVVEDRTRVFPTQAGRFLGWSATSG